MTRKTVLITGAAGGIGEGLCHGFQASGWRVVATDWRENANRPADDFIAIDLDRLCRDKEYRAESIGDLRRSFPNGLNALVNNAAAQIVASVEDLTVEDWYNSLHVNLIAPFLLTQAFLSQLEQGDGSVINIASVHALLTKPRFAAYATSKSALVGLTRSLAVELGGRIRVNAICPAAIATPMLQDGLAGGHEGLNALGAFHPSGCIGSIKDVVNVVVYLAETNNAFLNGAVLGLDGGIAHRLHDPE